jgi:hypothetical protein
MQIEEWWSHLPPALRPAYLFGEPNEKLPLYNGKLEIEQNNRSIQGHGYVYFKWFPYPQVEFHLLSSNLSSSNLSYDLNAHETFLKLKDIEGLFRVFISHCNKEWSDENSTQVRGQLKEPIIIGSGKKLAHIKFHLSNFHTFFGSEKSVFISEDSGTTTERLVFEAQGWRVIIDQLELQTLNQILQSLQSQPGYAITHIGKLEKSDQAVFAIDEASEFLEAFSDFLSFIRGFRVSPTLLVGYDPSEAKIWQEWKSSNSDPWKNVDSWAWGLDGINLVKAFPGFLRWWKDWGESAKLAIFWYLQSNRNVAGVEGSIILTQAALELLAWVTLVEKGRISETDFDKGKEFKHTSQKINKLLKHCGIPNKIPSEYANLTKFASEKDNNVNNNGPCALVDIRNNITHSNPKNRQTFANTPSSTNIEAWSLGLWYIELILLKQFNYNECYFKRIQKHGHRGDNEIVPWASQPLGNE